MEPDSPPKPVGLWCRHSHWKHQWGAPFNNQRSTTQTKETKEEETVLGHEWYFRSLWPNEGLEEEEEETNTYHKALNSDVKKGAKSEENWIEEHKWKIFMRLQHKGLSATEDPNKGQHKTLGIKDRNGHLPKESTVILLYWWNEYYYWILIQLPVDPKIF